MPAEPRSAEDWHALYRGLRAMTIALTEAQQIADDVVREANISNRQVNALQQRVEELEARSRDVLTYYARELSFLNVNSLNPLARLRAALRGGETKQC